MAARPPRRVIDEGGGGRWAAAASLPRLFASPSVLEAAAAAVGGANCPAAHGVPKHVRAAARIDPAIGTAFPTLSRTPRDPAPNFGPPPVPPVVPPIPQAPLIRVAAAAASPGLQRVGRRQDQKRGGTRRSPSTRHAGSRGIAGGVRTGHRLFGAQRHHRSGSQSSRKQQQAVRVIGPFAFRVFGPTPHIEPPAKDNKHMHGAAAATTIEHAPHGSIMTSTPAVLPPAPAPGGGDAAASAPAPVDTSSGLGHGSNGGGVGSGGNSGGNGGAVAANGNGYGDAHVSVATEGTAAGDAGAWAFGSGVGIGG